MKRRIKMFIPVLLMFVIIMGTTAFGSVYTYYKSRLYGQDKKIYSLMVSKYGSSKSFSYNVSSGTNLSGVFKERTLYAFILDHPEYYWVSGVSSSYTVNRGGAYTLKYSMLESWKGAFKTRTAFKKKYKKIAAKLKKKASGKSTAEKVKIIHDYVCSTCKYVSSKYDQTAYGALIKHKAVCAGYASAFKLLCDSMGIKCVCVPLLVDGYGHEVNFVRIGKKWYFVDCTWDDQATTVYNYFLLGVNSSGMWDVTSVYGLSLPKLSETDYAA